MTTIADTDSMHEAAKEAIDEAQLAEILEHAADGAYDEDAVVALEEVVADELVAITRAAIDRARRRGNPTTGEEIGEAADQRLSCCRDRQQRWIPVMAEWP